MIHVQTSAPDTSDLPPAPPAPPPDLILHAVRDGHAVARAAVWEDGPDLDGQPTGLIGSYAARDAEAGRAVLEAASSHLRDRGRALAVGPLDGSTWFSYRLVTESGDEPPFWLEPTHPPEYVAHWEGAGFAPRLSYSSALATPATWSPDPRAAELRARFAHVRVRPADPARADDDLAAIHALSLAAFAANPLYTPLPRAAFDGLYRPLLERAPLEWVWLAETGGEVVGFLFAVPDLLRPARDTLVVKTIATRPGRAHAGLGRHLVQEFHERAFASGVARVVHALMWDGNDSAAASARLGRRLRGYALLARELA